MFSKYFTEATKSIQNLFSTKMQQPPEMNYFDIMPTDILFSIFKKLELTDVMKCENISKQTKEAAGYYYRRRFSMFCLSSRSLAIVACCSDKNHKSNLAFAKVMFSVIGPYVRHLEIDYPTFCIDWAQPLSKMIYDYCDDLATVVIYGIPDLKIKMVNTQNVHGMTIFDCLFDKQPPLMTTSKLKSLLYQSSEKGSKTDIVKIIQEHPKIKKLGVYMTCIQTEQLQSIASLKFLKMLVVHIYPADTVKELKMQESADFPVFFRDLQSLLKLSEVEVRLPFYMRLSLETVNTSVKSLRLSRNCTVNLLTVVDNIEPEHIQSLRADLDGLSGVNSDIEVDQIDVLMSLLTCERLEVLRLLLCGQRDKYAHHQIEGVLLALEKFARTENCCLKTLELNAQYTEPVGVRYLPLVVKFFQVAKQLEVFTLINCTPELIKRKSLFKTSNIRVLFY